MQPVKYREIPKTITAVQFNGRNWEEIDKFVGKKGKFDHGALIYDKLFIKRKVVESDYVYKYDGTPSITRCLPANIFEKTFEVVNEST